MPNVSFKELKAELAKLNGKRVMVSFHSLGDTDAIASAIGIATILPGSVIAAPDKVTSNSLLKLHPLHCYGLQLRLHRLILLCHLFEFFAFHNIT